MITTILTCPKCRSQRLQKNGSSRGKAKYRCYDCGHQAVFAPAAPQRAIQYEQVMKLLVERNSQRSVGRVTGVARMTIARWIKKVMTEVVEAETAVLELDEMWTFVARRKRKVWRWLAVERASRRIVAWVLGCRGAATGRHFFTHYPFVISIIPRIIPTNGKPMPRCCPLPRTGPAGKAAARPTLSKP